MNEETTTIYFRSNSTTAIVYDKDTIPFSSEKMELKVLRKNEDLIVEVLADTTSY